MTRPRHRCIASSHNQRSHDQWKARSITIQQTARPARQKKHQHNQRRQRRPSMRRRVTLHLDQIQRQIKQSSAKRRIQKECQQVCTYKASVREQVQRKHRCAAILLVSHKHDQQHNSNDGDQLNVLSSLCALDQRISHATQSPNCQQSTHPIHSLRSNAFLPVRWNTPHHNRHRNHSQRRVDKEDPAPRPMLHQPSPNHRPQRGHHRGKPRPCPNGSAALFRSEMRAHQRQTVRHQHRSTHALHSARRNQLSNTVRHSAPHGSRGEQYRTREKDLSRPQPVTHRPANQQQRREQQRIRLDHPLRLRSSRAQRVLHRRQRHVYYCAVDKLHTRAHYSRSQHPCACARCSVLAFAGENRSFITRQPASVDHKSKLH